MLEAVASHGKAGGVGGGGGGGEGFDTRRCPLIALTAMQCC